MLISRIIIRTQRKEFAVQTIMPEVDLSVDIKALRAPGAGNSSITMVEATPDGTGTITTTCWTCSLTCSGCPETLVCGES
jgi:hypothetical protein